MQQYIRIFMPFINESKGYEHNGKAPAGRCLLESRSGVGKMVLWAQDLRPEALYKLHLIFKQGNRYSGLPLCSISPNASGKVEQRYSFDALDIEGFGLSLDQCLAVAVIASGGSGTAAPLCAYKDTEISWRNGFTVAEAVKLPTVEAAKESPKKVTMVDAIADSNSEKIKEIGEAEEAEGAGAEGQEGSDEVEELVEVEESVEAVEEEAHSLEVAVDPESILSDTFKEEVELMLKSHTHMQPFEKQNRDVQWVRISLNEDLTLPNNICDLLNEAFVEAAYRQYNHLILGKALDEGLKRYYIGIPALYDPKDKIIGFRQFKCSENAEPKSGDYGYWLIFMS